MPITVGGPLLASGPFGRLAPTPAFQ